MFVCGRMKLSARLSVCLCVSWGEGRQERASNPWGVCDWEGNGELGLREYEVEVEEGEGDGKKGRMKRAN